MTSTWSTSGTISSSTPPTVAGLMATPGALAQRPDPLHRAMQIVVALPVDQKRIGAGRGELLQEEVRVRDHQVDLEREPRHPPKRLDDRRAHREIRHEVPVHHVHVDPIGSRLLRLGHLLAQTGEVGG